MLENIPKDKIGIEIKTNGLPNLAADLTEYRFYLRLDRKPFELSIPGHHAGPDNCYPDSKLQEEWLDKLADRNTNNLVRAWDCLWYFNSEKGVEHFVDLLKTVTIETNYGSELKVMLLPKSDFFAAD